jgi:hypothetical protein
MCCQVVFASLRSALVEPSASTLAAPELWMLWLFGAGGLILDGADELLRVPAPLRAVGLVICIYALGYAAGWGLQQAGGDFPWDAGGHGFSADGHMRIEQAPYWFVLALCFRQLRHALDRVQAALVAAPATAQRARVVTVLESAPQA